MNSSDIIFLLEGEDSLQQVEQAPYETEDLLQRLIKKHPELLAGHQIDEEDPPRWLLVSREMGVPDSEGGADRWSVDHLFLDQHGIPTFVEVKRASDTRIRREVVGQMLDYAANAQKYWPVDRLRQKAEQQAGDASSLVSRITELLCTSPDEDPDEVASQFWSKVEENLRSGHLRLAFVADHVPSELRRIIEFLNEKLEDVQVVGLELVQYRKGELRVIVPRVVGQTEAALGSKSWTKGNTPARRITLEQFLSACPGPTRSLFAAVVKEAEERGLRVYWGVRGFSIGLTEELHGRRTALLYCWPPVNWKSADDPVLEAYIHEDAFTLEERERYRTRLKSAAPFEDRGEYTIMLAVNDKTIEQAMAALDVLWKIEKECTAGVRDLEE
jgi:hypothetical protein